MLIIQIQGAGVVGKIPIIKPGEQFEYCSSCACRSVTTMKGRYRLKDLSTGELFEVPINPFAVWMLPTTADKEQD